MNKPLRLTLGSDPELMLADAATGRIVSALRILRQNKHNPIVLSDDIKMYADNVLVESSFGPATSVGGVVARLREVLSRMQAKLGDGFYLVPQASHHYEECELGPKPSVMKGNLPEEWEIGCMPSEDVYTGEQHVPAPFQDGLRTGSFHLHIGNADYQNEDEKRLLTKRSQDAAIKLLDIFVGCPSILFDKDESSPARRVLYGRAGNFRRTRYGVEYRVLGNYALRHPDLAELVYDLAVHAMSHIELETHNGILECIEPELVQEAINTANPELAKEVILNASMPYKLKQRIDAASEACSVCDLYKAWRI